MQTRTIQPDYFGAGPALLPAEAINQAAADLIAYDDSGLGVGEISHRSAAAVAIVNDAKANLVKLLDVPDTHEVFFLQGGGTGGFSAIVYNMLAAFAAKTGKKGKADYFITGGWSKSAYAEAVRLGVETNVVADSRKVSPAGKFQEVPAAETWTFSPAGETAYVYYCDNETVMGTEFSSVPAVPEGVEIVCDMSSNILSRPVDVAKFGLIFAGAQKNVGIAGASIYIIKKSLLERPTDAELVALGVPLAPIGMEFKTVVGANSLYNTLPIFCVDVIKLTTQLLLDNGGLAAQQAVAERKAAKVYAALDAAPAGVYTLPVKPASRSRMNIVFTLASPEKEKEFLAGAKARGLAGLPGHRSVGGIRVSNYNAVSEASIDRLVAYLGEFAQA
ncbi:pyridoxal phosphate-dependent transferase [Dipodascopsis tothii]|uniref:pyridoxal phosphate-dependent transferase n=1 Tax=Dipodascopsis tothii TaxID=44089 RepID=UPI0034CF2E13